MKINLEKLLCTEKNLNTVASDNKKHYNVKTLLNNNNIDQSQSIKFGYVFQDFVKDILRNAGAKVSGYEKNYQQSRKKKI